MKKYTFNENYFEDINTEEKAYWLGFLYADGYVQNDEKNYQYRLTLRLQKSDITHIQKFANCINSNSPIQEIHSLFNGKEYVGVQISLYSKKIINDLYRLGCIQAKSLVLKPPTLREDLIRHFIRGYFDGDGSAYVSQKNPKKFAYSFLGTDAIINYIVSEAKLTHYGIRNAKKNTECKELRVSSMQEFLNLYNYMYNNANIYLERKYIKSKKIIDYFENNSLKKMKENKKKLICGLWEDGLDVNKISIATNFSKSNIVKYLKEGAQEGICNYDAEKIRETTRKNITKYRNLLISKNSKEVHMYDFNYCLIGKYNSVSELCKKSEDDFGVKLVVGGVSRVCRGERKHYKGFIFSYIPLEKQDNNSYLLCSNG